MVCILFIHQNFPAQFINISKFLSTKYHVISMSFSSKNIKGITQYELITSLGATEGANKLGTADLIVDLSSTGETLRQNNLKVIDTIMSSSACLFYSKKSQTGQNFIHDFLSFFVASG